MLASVKHPLKYFYAHDEGWEIKSGVGRRADLTTDKEEGEEGGRRERGWVNLADKG